MLRLGKKSFQKVSFEPFFNYPAVKTRPLTRNNYFIPQVNTSLKSFNQRFVKFTSIQTAWYPTSASPRFPFLHSFPKFSTECPSENDTSPEKGLNRKILMAMGLFYLAVFGLVVTGSLLNYNQYNRKWRLLLRSAKPTASLVDEMEQTIRSINTVVSYESAKPEYERIDRIFKKLLLATGELYTSGNLSQRWRILILEDESFNACIQDYGFLIVTTGALKLLKDDDELGVVLGHEVSHILHRHGEEQLAYSVLSEGFHALGEMVINYLALMIPAISDLLVSPWSITIKIALPLKHSRAVELEADRLGLFLSSRAGFNPVVAQNMWLRLQEQLQKDASADLEAHGFSPRELDLYKKLYQVAQRTHPDPLERAELSKQILPQAYIMYKQGMKVQEVSPWPQSLADLFISPELLDKWPPLYEDPIWIQHL